LSDEQCKWLVSVAARAYFSEEGTLDFEWDSCRGQVRAVSEAAAIGSFYGERFEAELHMPSGSTEVGFLVTEAQLEAAGASMAEA